MELKIEVLRKALTSGLPGWTAQKRMSPSVNDRYLQLSEDYSLAGVMALIYFDSEYKIILIQRAQNPNDRHAGQLGFPGGKYETTDGDMLTCALREVGEEIGIPSGQIDVVGPLSTLYVFASNYLVHPFLGILNTPPTFIAQESEVEQVLSVPLSTILDEDTKRKKDITYPRGVLRDVPYYSIGDKVLWGATAMMMSEVEEVLRTVLDYKE